MIERTGHTALVAANHVGLSVPETSRVDVLEEGRKSAVFRISWPGPPAGSIIVKRCVATGGRTERLMYERYLSRLRVTSLLCHGSWDDGRGMTWLVLEDAGDIEPQPDDPAARALLTEWVAALHLEGAGVFGDELPDRGCDHFARRLREARAHLVLRIEADEDHASDRKILCRAIERCDRLAEVWPTIEAICGRFPETLVHGDYVEENLRITTVSGDAQLVPLDWEKAGRGVPAVDLVRIDPGLYWEMTRGWQRATYAQLAELVQVGQIFRVLAHQWAAKSVGKVERAQARLASLTAGLEGR